jgi:hypothetical protein
MGQAFPASGSFTETFVVQSDLVRHCHIKLDDVEKPVPAIEYRSHFYSLFRALPDWEKAEKISSRLSSTFVITTTKKGWVIWVYEY